MRTLALFFAAAALAGAQTQQIPGTGGNNTTITGSVNYTTVSYSATPVFACSSPLGDIFALTLTGNVTSSTLTNCTRGETVTFNICQDATGSRTFVFPATVTGALTIGSTATYCSLQSFAYNGTNATASSLQMNFAAGSIASVAAPYFVGNVFGSVNGNVTGNTTGTHTGNVAGGALTTSVVTITPDTAITGSYATYGLSTGGGVSGGSGQHHQNIAASVDSLSYFNPITRWVAVNPAYSANGLSMYEMGAEGCYNSSGAFFTCTGTTNYFGIYHFYLWDARTSSTVWDTSSAGGTKAFNVYYPAYFYNNPVYTQPVATSQNGTAGTAVCSMAFTGYQSVKIATCYLNGYTETGAAQTYSFATNGSNFITPPVMSHTCTTTAPPTPTASTLTLPSGSSTPQTCTIVLMGQ